VSDFGFFCYVDFGFFILLIGGVVDNPPPPVISTYRVY